MPNQKHINYIPTKNQKNTQTNKDWFQSRRLGQDRLRASPATLYQLGQLNLARVLELHLLQTIFACGLFYCTLSRFNFL